jgi:hypothetical protein
VSVANANIGVADADAGDLDRNLTGAGRIDVDRPHIEVGTDRRRHCCSDFHVRFPADLDRRPHVR